MPHGRAWSTLEMFTDPLSDRWGLVAGSSFAKVINPLFRAEHDDVDRFSSWTASGLAV